jgi:hypothetical protein
VPRYEIALREWDGEFVVRNESTGNSHLLGLLAGRVLSVLLDARGPLGAAEIATRLDTAVLPMETGQTHDAVEEVLAEFCRLGLAEPEST